MIADTSPEPTSLVDLLAVAARRASDENLAALACVGVGGALVISSLFGRAGWLGAAASVAVGMYGTWGISDRMLNALWSTPGSDPTKINVLRLARAISAIVGALAAVSFFGSVFVPGLGLWRS